MNDNLLVIVDLTFSTPPSSSLTLFYTYMSDKYTFNTQTRTIFGVLLCITYNVLLSKLATGIVTDPITALEHMT